MDENTANNRPQVRAAAYLAAKERLDFRRGKTRALVQCNPPNVKCGNRCIPPEWDCRLKGQGADPHLRAVKTDPLGGLANIQRGITRITKGLPKGNFSEIEGGKRAIIRGTVKVAPGNIQQKKELQANLEEKSRVIGISLALVGGALGAHAILMRTNSYKYGVGRRINEAARDGVSTVLDIIPGLGQQRRITRTTATSRVVATGSRERAFVAEAGLSPRERILNTNIDDRWMKGRNKLKADLDKVDSAAWSPQGGSEPLSFYDWNQKHRGAFWKAATVERIRDKVIRRSIYAEPSAQQFLAQQWGLSGRDLESSAFIKDRIAASISQERSDYVQLAQQQGFKMRTIRGELDIDPSAYAGFRRRLTDGIVDDAVRKSTSEHIQSVLTSTPGSYASKIYQKTVDFYDGEFKEIGKILDETAGASLIDPVFKGKGYSEFIGDADAIRVQAMMRTGNAAIKTSLGKGHEELYLLAHYHTQGFKNKTSSFIVSDRIARAAAEEISGTRVQSTEEAFAILQATQDFRGASSGVKAAPKTGRSSEPRTTSGESSTPRPARRRTPAQVIASMMRQKNPDGSPRYASREAAEAAYKRAQEGRVDSAETHHFDPRVEFYLQTQARLDKRCGKSGIPENRKCTKTTTPQSEEARNRARGAAQPGVTCNPPNQKCGNLCLPPTATCHLKGGGGEGFGSKVAKGALAIGAATGVALAGRRAYKTRHSNTLYKGSANYISQGIQAMSSKQVRDGIGRLPKQWQQPANKLIGKAKVGLAYVSADAQGLKVKHIDLDNNFSTWQNDETGHTLSIGAVDDTLVTFVSERKGNAGQFPKYGVAFQTDLSFAQKEGVSKAQSLAVSKQVKSMFQNQLDQLPENAVLFNKPFKDDGLGAKRSSIYKRFKFREIKGLRGGEMYALKNQGKLTSIPAEQEDYVAELIRGGNTNEAAERYRRSRGDELKAEANILVRSTAYVTAKNAVKLRLDKKCGKSATSDRNKCTKPVAQQIGEALAVGSTVAAIGGAAYALSRASKGSSASRAYRPNPQPDGSTMPFPKGKTSKDWFELPNAPGVTEGARVRKYTSNLEFEPVNSTDYSNSVASIVGNTAEGRLVSQAIRKHNISIDSRVIEQIKNSPRVSDVNRKSIDNLTKQLDTMPVLEGGFIDPQHPGNNGVPPVNTIWVNHRRDSKTEFNPSVDGVKKGIDEFLSARSRSVSSDQISALGQSATATQKEDFVKSFTTYNNAERDDRDFLVALHESAHSLDVGFARRNKPPVADEVTFKKQASTVVSHYGLTDIDGSKDEFFAESTVLYALAPETLKKKAPLVYDWVDSYLKAIDSRL